MQITHRETTPFQQLQKFGPYRTRCAYDRHSITACHSNAKLYLQGMSRRILKTLFENPNPIWPKPVV